MPPVRLSRYEFSSIHKDECDRLFAHAPDPIPKVISPDDAVIIAGEGDTLFTIAFRAYLSLLDRESDIRPSGFYWVVAEANNILDPMAKITPGTRIRVPSIPFLQTEVLAPPPFFGQDEIT